VKQPCSGGERPIRAIGSFSIAVALFVTIAAAIEVN
jgi:hypothetical protein